MWFRNHNLVILSILKDSLGWGRSNLVKFSMKGLSLCSLILVLCVSRQVYNVASKSVTELNDFMKT